MDLHFGKDLSHGRKDTEVGNDDRVDPKRRDRSQEVAKRGIFVSVRHRVKRQIKLYPVRVRIGNGIGKLFIAEIICRRAHAKAKPCQIYGIGSVENRRAHFFKIARRRQKLGEFFGCIGSVDRHIDLLRSFHNNHIYYNIKKPICQEKSL